MVDLLRLMAVLSLGSVPWWPVALLFVLLDDPAWVLSA